MRNVMYFKDKDSAGMKCVVTALPSIPRTRERGEWEESAGMHGAQFYADGGREAIDMPVQMWVAPNADVNAVMDWLAGEGALRFNAWDWFWRARCDAQLLLAPCPFNDGWNTAVTFKVQPHRYKHPETTAFAVENGSILANPCSAAAEPLLEVAGSGDINLMIGNYSLLIDGLDGAIRIDCEALIAYGGNPETMMTGQVIPVSDLWPRLEPGANAVSWTGNATEVKITPRWRWL